MSEFSKKGDIMKQEHPTHILEDNPKLQSLKDILREIGPCVVAFSGGVDSTFLLKVACDTLGDQVTAVTILSPTYPQEEAQAAAEFARTLGVRYQTIHSSELDIPEFSDNPPDRCYYCKKTLFGELAEVAEQEKASAVLDATNADDQSDYRPGTRAARELGVRSPLLEAGITKQEIRDMSQALGLPTWDNPSMACLASRFPYGEYINEEKLNQVADAERVLRSLGFKQMRVRHHGPVARIEVMPELVSKVTQPDIRETLVAKLKALGFQYITLDLQGYRTGSLNELLSPEEKQATDTSNP